MSSAFSRIFPCLVVSIGVAFFGVGCQGWLLPDDLKAGDRDFVSADPSARAAGGGGLFATMDGAAPGDDSADNSGNAEEVAREIEEADLVKRIGDRLYILNRFRGLKIVDVSDWSSPTLRGAVPVLGEPVEMYVVDGLAMVVVRHRSQCRLDEVGEPVRLGGGAVVAVDVSDADRPVVLDEFALDGYVAESRRVGDVIYLAGYDEPMWRAMWLKEEDGAGNGFVVSVNIADPRNVQFVQQEDFVGQAEYIHATTEAVFIAGYDWQADGTTIQYVDISDPAGQIAIRGQCEVPGRILNRFALDSYEDVLRVVSQTWGEWSRGPAVGLTTFDVSDPDHIARLGELKIIEDETNRAVRFAGDVAYVVTFELVDPFWVIDLRDPSDPRITGELEVPGWSTHLVPDGDRVIAMGVSGDRRPVVALYDVSDPENPSRVSVVEFGDRWSYSEANYDDKALTVLPEAKLILVPFDTRGNESAKMGYQNRLAMLDYTDDTLVELADLAHRGTAIRSGVDLADSVLWVLSMQTLQTLDIADRSTPASLATLALAENVVSYQSVGQYALRVVRTDGGGLTLEVVSSSQPNGPVLAGAALDLQDGRLTMLGDKAVLTGSVENGTRMICVDLGGLPGLNVLSDTTFDFTVSGAWYGGPYMPHDMGMGGVAEMASFAPPNIGWWSGWLGNQGNPMVLGNGVLAFVAYGETFGRADYAQEVIKLVSLADPGDPQVTASVPIDGDGLDMVLRVSVAGNRVYYTAGQVTLEGLLTRLLGGQAPSVKFYLHAIDCADPSSPVSAKAVNIPGLAVWLEGDAVYTVDPYWAGDWELAYRFCSLTLAGGQATLARAVDLPDGEIDQVHTRSGLAVVAMSEGGTWFDGPVAMDSFKESECRLGQSRIMTLDIAGPQQLAIAGDVSYPAVSVPAGPMGDWLVAAVNSSGQILLLQIGEDKALTLAAVVEVPGSVLDQALRDGFLDIACGMAGVKTVELPQE